MNALKEVSIVEAVKLITGLDMSPETISNFNDSFWKKFYESTGIRPRKDRIAGGVEIFELEDKIKTVFAEKLKSLGVELL